MTLKEFSFILSIDFKVILSYQKSPKRLWTLKELGVLFEKSAPKLAKANGTRWIGQ